jgi:hypothetical protein
MLTNLKINQLKPKTSNRHSHHLPQWKLLCPEGVAKGSQKD